MWSFLKKLKVCIPSDTAIPLLSMLPKDFVSYFRGTCSSKFIAVLFTIPRTWKQPTGLPLDEWVMKIWHIYTTEYYSMLRKTKLLYLQVIGWSWQQSF